MKCNKCGTDLPDGALFCAECGTKTEPERKRYCPNCGEAAEMNDVFCQRCGFSFNAGAAGAANTSQNADIPQYVQTQKQKNNTAIIIAIAAAAAAVIICLCVIIFMQKGGEGSGQSQRSPITDAMSEGLSQTPQRPDVALQIDNYISANMSHSDVGVAVKDNRSGEVFLSRNAQVSYTAWGWYLQIYLVYDNLDYYSTDIHGKIMSSDAGVCNNNANSAIRAFGGPEGITDSLEWYFDTEDTIYGRYFGDVNATKDNYTTPAEAVEFLEMLDSENDYTRLSYNIAEYGISAPYGASVYAQVGTENKSVREELNLFAVVKGANSDYSVAIMTRGKAGAYISGLLDLIHTEMEIRAYE